MLPIDGDTLRAIAPRFSGAKHDRQSQIIESVSGVLRSTLSDYKINTALRIAHFLAQITHESAGLRTTEEFASGAAYEGRLDLGNTETGDGKRFKGRGLLQLTGRANYKSLGDTLGIDLVNNPTQAAKPKLSLVIACEYWKGRNINPHCDRNDLEKVTRLVNGGLNGLDDRRQYLVKSKNELARLGGNVIASNSDPSAPPVLRRGTRGEFVFALQNRLRDLGMQIGIDGDFGPATELAVMIWQSNNGLSPDGIVGPTTWAKLDIPAND